MLNKDSSAKDNWQILDGLYNKKGRRSIDKLWMKFMMCIQGNQTAQSFMAEICLTAAKLKEAEERVADTLIIERIARGLRPEFNGITNMLEHVEPYCSSLNEARKSVMRQQDRIVEKAKLYAGYVPYIPPVPPYDTFSMPSPYQIAQNMQHNYLQQDSAYPGKQTPYPGTQNSEQQYKLLQQAPNQNSQTPFYPQQYPYQQQNFGYPHQSGLSMAPYIPYQENRNFNFNPTPEQQSMQVKYPGTGMPNYSGLNQEQVQALFPVQRMITYHQPTPAPSERFQQQIGYANPPQYNTATKRTERSAPKSCQQCPDMSNHNTEDCFKSNPDKRIEHYERMAKRAYNRRKAHRVVTRNRRRRTLTRVLCLNHLFSLHELQIIQMATSFLETTISLPPTHLSPTSQGIISKGTITLPLRVATPSSKMTWQEPE